MSAFLKVDDCPLQIIDRLLRFAGITAKHHGAKIKQDTPDQIRVWRSFGKLKRF